VLCGLFDPVRPCSASTREIPATATASPGAAASVSSRDPGGGPRISALTGAPSSGLAGLNEIAELHRVLARAPFRIAADARLEPGGLARPLGSAETGLRHTTILE